MMHSYTTSATAVATSTPVNMGLGGPTLALGYQAVVSGTSTYNVEVTLNGTTWTAVASGLSANSVGSIAYPVVGIRLNLTAGTGTVTLTVLEVR